MFFTLLIITLSLVAICFVAIGIKMFVKKDGRFERRCENEGTSHCLCGGKGGDACQRCPRNSCD